MADLGAQGVMGGEGGDRLALHVQVPEAQGEVVARQQVPPVPRQLDVRYAVHYLREECLRLLNS